MKRFNVLIGVPSSGVICEGTAQATYQASLHHDFDRVPSTWSGPNFNRCWKEAMNAGMKQQYTHFAIVHADIKVLEDHLVLDGMGEIVKEQSKLWLDVMLDDIEASGVPFLSCPIALKDSRGMLSCGIGDPADAWTIWRRFCVNELEQFPDVFTCADVGYPDKYLLHSIALSLFDLRTPCWYKHDPKSNNAPAMFNFSEKIVWNRVKCEWEVFCQSEDWAFSRMLWRAGINSALTRNVKVNHLTGNIEFPNHGDWGTYKNGDEELAYKWRDKPAAAERMNGVPSLPVTN